jgi:hypothetical protein
MRSNMRSKLALLLAMAALGLSACGQRDQNSEGNGPGNADGFGGRADPPTQEQPADRQQQPAEEQPQQ